MSAMTTGEIMEMRSNTLRPFYTWTGQIQKCREMEEGDAELFERFVVEITNLRQFFGEDFPERALQEDHDMGRYFYNNVRWTKEWLIALSKAITACQYGKNFKEVEDRLKSSAQGEFDEAETVLLYAMKFIDAGYDVNFEQRVLNKRGLEKFPDLQVIDPATSDLIFVEICQLKPSDLDRALDALMHRIQDAGIDNQKWLKFSVAIHRRLEKNQLPELLDQIIETARRAARAGRLEELVIPDLVTAAVAGYNDPALIDWTQSHQMDVNACYGPDDPPFYRINRNILKKELQASVHHPTFVIIRVEDLSLYHATADEWIAAVDSTLAKCEYTAAVLLSMHQIGNSESSVMHTNNAMAIIRNEGQAWRSESLLIFNRHSPHSSYLMQNCQTLLRNFL